MWLYQSNKVLQIVLASSRNFSQMWSFIKSINTLTRDFEGTYHLVSSQAIFTLTLTGHCPFIHDKSHSQLDHSRKQDPISTHKLPGGREELSLKSQTHWCLQKAACPVTSAAAFASRQISLPSWELDLDASSSFEPLFE